MTTALIPVDVPALQPLQGSAEYDDLESGLKAIFMAVFERHLRPGERQLNLHGMPHLGTAALMERVLKANGLPLVRRDDTRTAFLMKAALSRNKRRGMIFLRQYLQATWPNVWKVEPLYHPIATANEYPKHITPLGTLNLGNGITAVYDDYDGTAEPVLYRTDWQGTTRLASSTGWLTNILRQSRNLSTAPWMQNLGGFWKSESVAAVVGPDNVTGDVTKFTATGYPHHIFTMQPGINAVAGARTVSLWVLVPSGQSVGRFGVGVTWDGIESAGGMYSAFNRWVRVSGTATLAASRSRLELSIYPNGVNPLPGFFFYACYAQDEPGTVANSFLATGANPSTHADYTIDANGVATFADGLIPPTPIMLFRTSRVRVTLPVSSDNGRGLSEVGKAFRSVLAARLMLELQLSTVFDDVGLDGGIALANGAMGVMPVLATGTLS
ncbi:phage head spike fiber domain-containing protein [Burkholderia ubonensis]|uniref:Uncharacterized protein n=1 Tax=Burkholderia ubonensis TaxID=101571 RepID=A0ABD4DZY0_9BURK|nr:hypothetical protein [Burkholderia ubonensis]KVN83423.1 hypothetical protein WJ68_16030 [Burkholderia ubonensis]